MTKPVLYMLLGAICSNAWWLFLATHHPIFGFAMVISSVLTVAAIVIESEDARKGRS